MALTVDAPAFEVPPRLRDSPLLQVGGFAVFSDWFDDTTLDALRTEAWSNYAGGTDQQCWIPDDEEFRGGTPRRKLITAGAGPVQDALYASPAVHDALSTVCGMPIVPSGNRGSYSYYVRPGDFLGLHRDIPTCDVALITVLFDSGSDDQGGTLVAYPGRMTEPLSQLRVAPDEGAVAVTMNAGDTIVMYGGLVPHRIRRTADGQSRIVSVLCFQPAAA
jgi:hypothetical protein